MMSNTNIMILKRGIIFGLVFLFTGCAAVHSTRLAYKCETNLSIASTELESAKVNGFSSTVSWTKAASLLTAAKIQQQFEKFPNCINKVARARIYINRSKAI